MIFFVNFMMTVADTNKFPSAVEFQASTPPPTACDEDYVSGAHVNDSACTIEAVLIDLPQTSKHRGKSVCKSTSFRVNSLIFFPFSAVLGLIAILSHGDRTSICQCCLRHRNTHASKRSFLQLERNIRGNSGTFPCLKRAVSTGCCKASASALR